MPRKKNKKKKNMNQQNPSKNESQHDSVQMRCKTRDPSSLGRDVQTSKCDEQSAGSSFESHGSAGCSPPPNCWCRSQDNQHYCGTYSLCPPNTGTCTGVNVSSDNGRYVEHYPQSNHHGSQVDYMVGHFESERLLRRQSQSSKTSRQSNPTPSCPDLKPPILPSQNINITSGYSGLPAKGGPPTNRAPTRAPPPVMPRFYPASAEQSASDLEYAEELYKEEQQRLINKSYNITKQCNILKHSIEQGYQMSPKARNVSKSDANRSKEAKCDTTYLSVPHNRVDNEVSKHATSQQTTSAHSRGLPRQDGISSESDKVTCKSISDCGNINGRNGNIHPLKKEQLSNDQSSPTCEQGVVKMDVGDDSCLQTLQPEVKNVKSTSFFLKSVFTLFSPKPCKNQPSELKKTISGTSELCKEPVAGVEACTSTSVEECKQHLASEFEKLDPLSEDDKNKTQNKNTEIHDKKTGEQQFLRTQKVIRRDIANIVKKVEQIIVRDTKGIKKAPNQSAQVHNHTNQQGKHKNEGSGASYNPLLESGARPPQTLDAATSHQGHQNLGENRKKTRNEEAQAPQITSNHKQQTLTGIADTAEDSGSDKQPRSEKQSFQAGGNTKGKKCFLEPQIKKNVGPKLMQNIPTITQETRKQIVSEKIKNLWIIEHGKSKNTNKTSKLDGELMATVKQASPEATNSVSDPPIQHVLEHKQEGGSQHEVSGEWGSFLKAARLETGYFVCAEEMEMQFCMELENLVATVSVVNLNAKKFWGPLSKMEELQQEIADLLRQLETLLNLDPPQTFKQRIDSAVESLQASRELLENRMPMLEAQSEAAASPQSAETEVTRVDPLSTPSAALQQVTSIAMEVMRLYRQVCNSTPMTRGQRKMLGNQLTQCQVMLDDIKGPDPEAREASRDVHNVCHQAQDRLSQQ